MIEVTQLDVTRRSPKTSSSLLRIGPRHGADTRGGEAAPRLLGGALLERIETAAGLDQLADPDERLRGVGEEAQGSGFLKAIAATAPASGASHSWAAEKLPSDSSRKPRTWLFSAMTGARSDAAASARPASASLRAPSTAPRQAFTSALA